MSRSGGLVQAELQRQVEEAERARKKAEQHAREQVCRSPLFLLFGPFCIHYSYIHPLILVPSFPSFVPPPTPPLYARGMPYGRWRRSAPRRCRRRSGCNRPGNTAPSSRVLPVLEIKRLDGNNSIFLPYRVCPHIKYVPAFIPPLFYYRYREEFEREKEEEQRRREKQEQEVRRARELEEEQEEECRRQEEEEEARRRRREEAISRQVADEEERRRRARDKERVQEEQQARRWQQREQVLTQDNLHRKHYIIRILCI